MKTKKFFTNTLGDKGLRLIVLLVVEVVSTMALIFLLVPKIWPSTAWDWTNTAPIWIALIAIALFYLGIFIRTLAGNYGHDCYTWWYTLGRPISNIAYNVLNYKLKFEGRMRRFKNLGIILIFAGLTVFVAGLFLVLDHHGWLKITFTVLGGCALVAFEIFLLNKLDEKTSSNSKTFTLVLLFFLVTLTYYLDFFIFAWNEPWISLILVAILIVFSLAALSYRRFKKIKNITKEKKRLKNLAEEKRLTEEKARAHFEELQKLGLYQLFLNYVHCKKNGQQEETALIIKAYVELKQDAGASLNQEEKGFLLQKISFINFNVDQELFIWLAQEYNSDYTAMLFTHTALSLDESGLPILFRYSKRKKEIIADFIKLGLPRDRCFNPIKREFRLKEFMSLINALSFSYQKEWADHKHLIGLVKAIEEVLAFGAECVPKLWNKDEAEELIALLEIIKKTYSENGIQVKFPKIPKIPKVRKIKLLEK